mmetsp:Transcript_5638/g.14291  ORF Transcript_5638/g.14291 Transcript_5638/m.14291 type:complete len:81 (+) Transcript_5638:1446-1688(+)
MLIPASIMITRQAPRIANCPTPATGANHFRVLTHESNAKGMYSKNTTVDEKSVSIQKNERRNEKRNENEDQEHEAIKSSG